MKILSFLIFWLVSTNAFAHGGGESAIEVGPGKGVTEVAPDKSFKLAPEAVQRLEISFLTLGQAPYRVPKSSISQTLKDSEMYRVRAGWIKSVDFKIVSKSGPDVVVTSIELKPGDQIVDHGVGFIRIIALQLGKEEDHHDD